jgi:hypothetical protein
MKIKYKYGVHHLTDTYPNEEDALYDICSFLHERGKMHEEWSDLGIKPAFKKKLEEEEIDRLLTSLFSQGYLHQRIGAGKRKYYKILNHGFGNTFSAPL